MKKFVLVFSLFLFLFVFSGCDDQPSSMIIESRVTSSITTTNNITNNITLAGANITNIYNYTINGSVQCGVGDYVYNVTITDNVITILCRDDQTGSAGGGNSTTEMINAINNSGYYNITINASNILNSPWITSYTDTNDTGLYYTKSEFNVQNNSLWSSINLKLDSTDQRYNDTLLINGVNTSNNIKGLGFNLTTELDTIYYSILNPSNFISDGNTNWDNSYGFITLLQGEQGLGNWSNENSTIRSLIDGKQPLFVNSSVECSGTDKLMNITSLNGIITGVCATDQTGGAASGDGAGGWENSTTNTNTTLHVQVLNNYLNVTNTGQANLWLQGTSAKVTYTETDSDDWTMLLSGGDFFFKQETAASKSFNVRGSDNIDRLSVKLQNSLVVVNSSLQVTGLNSASCDVKAYTNGTLYCGTDATGSGSGATLLINYTSTPYSTTSNTIYVPMPQLSTTLDASSSYIVECWFTTYAAAVTTGEQLQVNLSGTPTSATFSYNSQVSATTRTSYQGVSTSTNAFADAGSAGTNVRDTSILSGYVVTSGSTSTLTYAMKSEVSASNAVYDSGSYCKYIKVA